MSKQSDEAWKRLRIVRNLSIISARQLNFTQDVENACKQFGLDASKSTDREALLGLLSFVLLPAKRKGALTVPRKKKWTPQLEAALDDYVGRILIASKGLIESLNSDEIAMLLKRVSPTEWKQYDDSTLARYVRASIRRLNRG